MVPPQSRGFVSPVDAKRPKTQFIPSEIAREVQFILVIQGIIGLDVDIVEIEFRAIEILIRRTTLRWVVTNSSMGAVVQEAIVKFNV